MSGQVSPCGCRSGCQHRDHPQFPAQRECRAGIEPAADRAAPPDPVDVADQLAATLGITLQTWQRAVLAAGLPPKWSQPLTLTPEQAARARWGSWRGLRTRSTSDRDGS